MIPKVTVYMPTGGRDYIRPAVESVLAQNYPDFELIVVDDSPEGKVQSMISDLLERDHRLSVLKNHRSKGACGARNTALDAAQGYFVTGIDDDDFMLPGRIEAMASAWDDSYSLVFCGHFRRTDGYDKPVPVPALEVSHDRILHYNLIGNQILTRRDYIHGAGLFDEELPSYQDYDMWVRLIHKYGPAKGVERIDYIFNCDATGRISNSRPRRRRAWLRFIHKHRPWLTLAHRKSQCLQALQEQWREPSLLQLMKLLNRWNWKIVAVMLRRRYLNR